MAGRKLNPADASAPPEKRARRPDVEFRRIGDDLTFTWPRHLLTATLSRLRERADGLAGELLLSHERAGNLFWGHLALASTSARERIAQKLKRDIGTEETMPNWGAILDHLCYMAAHEFRTDGTTVLVGADDIPDRPPFLIPPLLLNGELNMLFGASGTGKGHMATALALIAEGRVPVLGLPVPEVPAPVLWLDWEWNRDEANRRLQAICRGLGVPRQTFAYRRCAGLLADQTDTIRSEILQRGIRLLIVDSVGLACGIADGGDPSGPFIRMAGDLRSLPDVTTLLIDHDAKAAERGRETPYGTRYKLALCRNIWHIRKTQEPDRNELHIGLWHDPSSNIAPQPPLGFRLQFVMDETDVTILRALTFHREDVRDVEGFSDLLTDWQRIERSLAQGPLATKDIAEAIGKPDNLVRGRLHEKARKGLVNRLPDKRWVLLDRVHEP